MRNRFEGKELILCYYSSKVWEALHGDKDGNYLNVFGKAGRYTANEVYDLIWDCNIRTLCRYNYSQLHEILQSAGCPGDVNIFSLDALDLIDYYSFFRCLDESEKCARYGLFLFNIFRWLSLIVNYRGYVLPTKEQTVTLDLVGKVATEVKNQTIEYIRNYRFFSSYELLDFTPDHRFHRTFLGACSYLCGALASIADPIAFQLATRYLDQVTLGGKSEGCTINDVGRLFDVPESFVAVMHKLENLSDNPLDCYDIKFKLF